MKAINICPPQTMVIPHYTSTECTKTTIYKCLQMIYLILKEKNNLITISVAVTTQKLTEKTLYAMHYKVV